MRRSTPASGRLLLDTSIIIALFAEEQSVHNLIATAVDVFVPSIALGELYFGAHKSIRVQDNISRIDEFAESNVVLSCDLETAKIYGEIKNQLRKKGSPIPENDIWIAAIASQYNLAVATRDEHFSLIDALSVELIL